MSAIAHVTHNPPTNANAISTMLMLIEDVVKPHGEKATSSTSPRTKPEQFQTIEKIKKKNPKKNQKTKKSPKKSPIISGINTYKKLTVIQTKSEHCGIRASWYEKSKSLIVEHVEMGSPAHIAGFSVGDCIVTANNSVLDSHDCIDRLSNCSDASIVFEVQSQTDANGQYQFDSHAAVHRKHFDDSCLKPRKSGSACLLCHKREMACSSANFKSGVPNKILKFHNNRLYWIV